MNPMLEDETAELLRNVYGGFANVELTGDGGRDRLDLPVRPWPRGLAGWRRASIPPGGRG